MGSPGLYMLAWNYDDAAHRAADLGNHWRGMKAVVGDGAGQPQSSRQSGGLDGEHLDVGHLV